MKRPSQPTKKATRMPVSFEKIHVGQTYSRQTLAELWGYSGYQALARGVVTPRNGNKIILFVTSEKQSDAEQYDDQLVGNVLNWEGPNDHFAEDRMFNAATTGDEIHLFYRERHHSDFEYHGKLKVLDCAKQIAQPSRFTMEVC